MDAHELQLDVSAEGARALQRVVRAMHDGHCPNCGHLGPSHTFERHEYRPGQSMPVPNGHYCPACAFATTEAEERAALAAFQPHFRKSVEVFFAWRQGRALPI